MRGHAEPRDHPIGEEQGRDECGCGRDRREQAEEPGERVCGGVVIGSCPGERQVEGEEQDGEQDRRERHPLHDRGAANEPESLLHLIQRPRLRLMGTLPDHRGSPTPADQRSADHRCGGQARRPYEQEVLGAEEIREGPGQETADHHAEDGPGAEQGEQPLRLAGVHDDAEQPPREEPLQQHHDGGGQPQHRIDPRGDRCHQGPFDQQRRGRDQGDHEEQASAREQSQQRRDDDRGHEQQPAGDDQHHRQLVRAGVREEETIGGALPERRTSRGEHHQRDPETGRPTFAGPDLQQSAEPDHAVPRATSLRAVDGTFLSRVTGGNLVGHPSRFKRSDAVSA